MSKSMQNFNDVALSTQEMNATEGAWSSKKLKSFLWALSKFAKKQKSKSKSKSSRSNCCWCW